MAFMMMVKPNFFYLCINLLIILSYLGAKKLFECFKMYKNIKRIPLQDLISKEIKMDFKKVSKKRKFKLKKKKKKKKKGGKKKKK